MWLTRPRGSRRSGAECELVDFYHEPGCEEVLARVRAEMSGSAPPGEPIRFPAWLRLGGTHHGAPVVWVGVGEEILGRLKPVDVRRVATDLRRLARSGRVLWIDGFLSGPSDEHDLKFVINGARGFSTWESDSDSIWKTWVHLAYSFSVTFGVSGLAAYGAATAHGLIRILLVVVAALAFILGLVVVFFVTTIQYLLKKTLRMTVLSRSTR